MLLNPYWTVIVMNDEDWMKKRSWRKGSGCAFILVAVVGLGWLSLVGSGLGVTNVGVVGRNTSRCNGYLCNGLY